MVSRSLGLAGVGSPFGMSWLEFVPTAPHNTYNQYQSKFVRNIYFGIILPVLFACVARLTISFPYSDSMSRAGRRCDDDDGPLGTQLLTINVHDVGMPDDLSNGSSHLGYDGFI